MNNMTELYNKVANDSALQEKFMDTMKDAEKAAADAVIDKLIAFAKDAGFDVTASEVQEFFTTLNSQQNKELSDADLDMVAGGKLDATAIGCSVCSLGFTCALASAVTAVVKDSCGQYFQD